METLSLVLRIILIVLGIALLCSSVISLTRPATGWPQRSRFMFATGISALSVLRSTDLFVGAPIPVWSLIVTDVLFAIGVWGCALSYREYPAFPRARKRRATQVSPDLHPALTDEPPINAPAEG